MKYKIELNENYIYIYIYTNNNILYLNLKFTVYNIKDIQEFNLIAANL